jgi:hypothetical protein
VPWFAEDNNGGTAKLEAGLFFACPNPPAREKPNLVDLRKVLDRKRTSNGPSQTRSNRWFKLETSAWAERLGGDNFHPRRLLRV